MTQRKSHNKLALLHKSRIPHKKNAVWLQENRIEGGEKVQGPNIFQALSEDKGGEQSSRSPPILKKWLDGANFA